MKKNNETTPFDLAASRNAWQRAMATRPAPEPPARGELLRRRQVFLDRRRARRTRYARQVAAAGILFLLSGGSYAVAQQREPDARLATNVPHFRQQSFQTMQEITALI